MERRKVLIGGAAVLAALAGGTGLLLVSREVEAASMQAAIQAALPPGFWVSDATFRDLSSGGDLWLSMKYGYCDQSKWLAVRAGVDLHSVECLQDVAAQIEMQPILDHIEEHPDHYATVVRCLRKQGWT